MQQHEIDEADVRAQHGTVFGPRGDAGLWRELLRVAGFMRVAGRLLCKLIRANTVFTDRVTCGHFAGRCNATDRRIWNTG